MGEGRGQAGVGGRAAVHARTVASAAATAVSAVATFFGAAASATADAATYAANGIRSKQAGVGVRVALQARRHALADGVANEQAMLQFEQRVAEERDDRRAERVAQRRSLREQRDTLRESTAQLRQEVENALIRREMAEIAQERAQLNIVSACLLFSSLLTPRCLTLAA